MVPALVHDPMAILEVACFNAESAIIACEAGADRIELCDEYRLGGTTPSTASVLSTLAIAGKKNIPVFAMIRPRGGGFVYSDYEFSVMEASLQTLKGLGVDGFVFGVLKDDSTIDVTRTRRLVRAAHPLPCTFHRAFDETPDILQALEDICETGCVAILSSGKSATAIAGSDVLAKLVEKAGSRLVIVPGGGVRSANIRALQSSTNATAFHTAALSHDSQLADAEDILRMKDDLARLGS